MYEPSYHFEPEEGDLFFQDLEGNFSTAIETVNPGFMGSDVAHVGMFVKTENERHIIEAFPPQVRLTPINSFLFRRRDKLGRPKVFVGRLKDEFRHLIPAAKKKALAQQGMPYNRVFLTEEEAFYCSELILDAFRHANRGTELFPLSPMSFKEPKTGRTLDYWEEYFSRYGLEVPEGALGSHPGKLSLSDKIDIVHRYGYLTNWY